MIKSVAGQFAESPDTAGIQRIFAIAGGGLNGGADSLRRRSGIEWVGVRHTALFDLANANSRRLS
jgi:pyruvate dehydrogenase (quinone)